MTSRIKWKDFVGLTNDEMVSLLDGCTDTEKKDLTQEVQNYFFSLDSDQLGTDEDEEVFEFLAERLYPLPE
jgi:hypothetical protein